MLYALCSAFATANANLPEERLDTPGGSSASPSAAGYSNYNITEFFGSASDDAIRFDTEDPMFFELAEDFVSRTMAQIGNESMSLSQRFSYGINGNMVFAGNISLQNNYHTHDNGFSDIGLMLMYRTPGQSAVKTDVYGGINFAGAGATNVPRSASTVYVTGARIGRQWVGMTLAGVVQASWIFHEVYGMAYIDLAPEVYFRLHEGWGLGANVVFRKATDPNFDQEWVGGKIAKRFGRTMYAGTFDYEFESDEWKVGFRLNLLF